MTTTVGREIPRVGAGELLRGGRSHVRRWAVDAPTGAPTVVAVPAAAAQSLAFRPLAAALSPLPLAAFDLPGHGSSKAAPLQTVEELATEVEQWVRTSSDGPVVLLGHSFGAYVAYEAARHLSAGADARPVSLVLVCSAAPGIQVLEELPAGDAEVLTFVAAHGGVPEQLLAHPGLLQPMIELLRVDLAAATLFSATVDVRDPLEVPALLVQGLHDGLVRPGMMAPWLDRLPRARLVDYPGGHFLPRDLPDRLALDILALLSG